MSQISQKFGKLIRKLLPVDYFATYQCKVQSQNPDGTLELEPFDERLGLGLSQVELGLPAGVESYKVKPGALCMVSFRNGKQDAPFVEFWGAGSFSELALKADSIVLNDGTQPVARKGDLIGTLTGANGGGAVNFVYTAPDGTVVASPTIVLKIGAGNPSVKA